jgi:hypothetical protein
MLPEAGGLVVGAALVLAENAGFWTFWFIDNSDEQTAGPALYCLDVAVVVVAAAAVVVVTSAPLAGRPVLRGDWRVACALVVVAGTVLSLELGPDTYTVPDWIAASVGTLLLGMVALPITLAWLQSEQRRAALVAVTLFCLWLVYFPISELVAEYPRLGLDPSVWVGRIVGVGLALAACFAAQAGASRDP